MSRSEFRYNKKRKHYAYLFKDLQDYRKNILITTKPIMKIHGKNKRNVKLYKHPNPNLIKDVFIIPYVYIDDKNVFYPKVLNWQFDKNDKRKVKRIKKKKIAKIKK